MRKTGSSWHILFLLLLAVWGNPSLTAGQPSFSVEATVSESTVFSGERLQLNVTIQGDFSNVNRPDLPPFDGLRLLSSTPSTSRNISYSNGVTRSSYTYSYALLAQTTGTFTIPGVSIAVDGTTYTTDPIQINVVDRNDAAADNTGNSSADIFLRMNVSDSQPVLSQQLLATIVLYFKQGLEVSSYQPIPGWKAEGFWKEELNNGERPEVESTIINGERYRMARLLQFALFPTKAGPLTISPYEVQLTVRSASQRSDPFSSFFGSFGNNRRQIELETEPVTINVQPLPDPPDSAEYIGAVGSFTISRRIDAPTNPQVGESIEVITEISGTGNITLLNKPEYSYPDGLEVYEPQENVQVNRTTQRINGTKEFTDVIIARTPGTVRVPATTLAYFDPSRGEYVTKMLPSRTFSVAPGNNGTATRTPSAAGSLEPVTGLASWSTTARPAIWSYWWLWAALLLPILLLGLAYWQKTYRNRMENDSAFARSKKSDAIAHERLQQALAHSEKNQIKAAYNALQKALTGFIGDRLNLPQAGLSIAQYTTALEEAGVDSELIENTRMLLNKCATINYAPNASQEYLKSHVGLAESIIDKLKKQL